MKGELRQRNRKLFLALVGFALLLTAFSAWVGASRF